MDRSADGERLAPDVLEKVLEQVLAANPEAAIGAVSPEGRFCDLPTGFDPGRRQVLTEGSGLEFVLPEARLAVIEGWRRAQTTGVSVTHVRYDPDRDDTSALHMIDLTHRYGVFLTVMVRENGAPTAVRTVERLRESTKMGRVRKDEVAKILDADQEAGELLGFAPGELADRRSLDLVHPEEQDRAVDCWLAMLAEPDGVRTVRLRHLRGDGSYLWVDISNRNLLDADESCVVADMIDVSAEMDALEALREREQLLARLTDVLPVGVLQIDAERQVVFANQQLYDILGTEIGADLSTQLDRVAEADRSIVGEALEAVLGRGIDRDIRVRIERGGEDDWHLLQVELRALTAPSGRVTGAVASVDDVTDHVRLQIELENRAAQDPLTGCFNRGSMIATLDELLRSEMHVARGTALIYFDIDDFKQVNDRLGHGAGDEILRTVVRRAETVVRHHDMLGRLGGDEFLVVCPGIADEDEAMAIAQRMSEVMNRPVTRGRDTVDVRTSIGVAWSDDPGATAEWLVSQADRVMYESKRVGIGQPIGRRASDDVAAAPVSRPSFDRR